MRLLAKLRAYARVLLGTRYGRTPDLVKLLARRPALMAGTSAYEAGLFASSRVDGRLKALAQIKTGALIGCPF